MMLRTRIRRYLGIRKKPIGDRFLAAIMALFGLLTATQAVAQPALITEDEAVALAIEVSGVTRAADARAADELARTEGDIAPPDPSIRYTREQAFLDAGAGGEDIVVGEFGFRRAGRAGALRDAASYRADVLRLHGETERIELARTVRIEFYRLLAAQERVSVYRAWLTIMAGVEGELKERVEAGESAPYELQRIRKEIADIEAEVVADEANVKYFRATLAARMGLDQARLNEVQASGELMPDAVPSDEEILGALGGRPDLLAYDRRLAGAEALSSAATKLWFPAPTIVAGYRRVFEPGETAHGFVAGIGLDIPLFASTRVASERDMAEAERIEATTQREVLLRRLRGEALGHAARVRTLKDAVDAYRREGLANAESVVKTVELAYRAGEVGILEFVDGYRGLVAARLKLVQLAEEARISDIEIKTITAGLPGTGGNDE